MESAAGMPSGCRAGLYQGMRGPVLGRSPKPRMSSYCRPLSAPLRLSGGCLATLVDAGARSHLRTQASARIRAGSKSTARRQLSRQPLGKQGHLQRYFESVDEWQLDEEPSAVTAAATDSLHILREASAVEAHSLQGELSQATVRQRQQPEMAIPNSLECRRHPLEQQRRCRSAALEFGATSTAKENLLSWDRIVAEGPPSSITQELAELVSAADACNSDRFTSCSPLLRPPREPPSRPALRSFFAPEQLVPGPSSSSTLTSGMSSRCTQAKSPISQREGSPSHSVLLPTFHKRIHCLSACTRVP